MGEETPAKTIDIKGKICPYTLIETRDALKTMNPGETLLVLTDYAPAANETIPNFCKKKGYPMEILEDGAGSWKIRIVRKE